MEKENLDYKLNSEIERLNKKANEISVTFESRVWNTWWRFKKLRKLKKELTSIQRSYEILGYEQGVEFTRKLKMKMNSEINAPLNLKAEKAELAIIASQVKETKESLEGYYKIPIKEKVAIVGDLINRLNQHHTYIETLQTKYNNEKMKGLIDSVKKEANNLQHNLETKVFKRLGRLAGKVDECDYKLSRTIFSRQTRRIKENLEATIEELSAWESVTKPMLIYESLEKARNDLKKADTILRGQQIREKQTMYFLKNVVVGCLVAALLVGLCICARKAKQAYQSFSHQNLSSMVYKKF